MIEAVKCYCDLEPRRNFIMKNGYYYECSCGRKSAFGHTVRQAIDLWNGKFENKKQLDSCLCRNDDGKKKRK